MNSKNTTTGYVQERFPYGVRRPLHTGVVLLEALLGHPLVPVCACAVQCALVLYGVLDHTLAFENLQSKAH